MAEEMPHPSGPPDFRLFPWDDLYPRLLLAALGRLNRMVWRGERRGRDCRNFRVWGRMMLLKEPSYAATQTACHPG